MKHQARRSYLRGDGASVNLGETRCPSIGAGIAVFLVTCQPELYYTSTAVASYATTHFPITGICEEVKILKSLPKVTIYIRRLCSCGWEILFSV